VAAVFLGVNASHASVSRAFSRAVVHAKKLGSLAEYGAVESLAGERRILSR
jgi:hypothetical protein